MFWKQEFVRLAVRARALPPIRAGGRECWIRCLGLCPAEMAAIPRKKLYKQQWNAKKKGSWGEQSHHRSCRCQDCAAEAAQAPRSSAQPGHARKGQTDPGRADTAPSGLRQIRGTGKRRKTFLRARGVSACSCSRSGGHEASKAQSLHGTLGSGRETTKICFDK